MKARDVKARDMKARDMKARYQGDDDQMASPAAGPTPTRGADPRGEEVAPWLLAIWDDACASAGGPST